MRALAAASGWRHGRAAVGRGSREQARAAQLIAVAASASAVGEPAGQRGRRGACAPTRAHAPGRAEPVGLAEPARRRSAATPGGSGRAGTRRPRCRRRRRPRAAPTPRPDRRRRTRTATRRSGSEERVPGLDAARRAGRAAARAAAAYTGSWKRVPPSVGSSGRELLEAVGLAGLVVGRRRACRRAARRRGRSSRGTPIGPPVRRAPAATGSSSPKPRSDAARSRRRATCSASNSSQRSSSGEQRGAVVGPERRRGPCARAASSSSATSLAGLAAGARGARRPSRRARARQLAVERRRGAAGRWRRGAPTPRSSARQRLDGLGLLDRPDAEHVAHEVGVRAGRPTPRCGSASTRAGERGDGAADEVAVVVGEPVAAPGRRAGPAPRRSTASPAASGEPADVAAGPGARPQLAQAVLGGRHRERGRRQAVGVGVDDPLGAGAVEQRGRATASGWRDRGGPQVAPRAR